MSLVIHLFTFEGNSPSFVYFECNRLQYEQNVKKWTVELLKENE